MRICIYEDSQSTWLEPIALTRPAFGLWCGAERLFERHLRQFPSSDVGFWMRPELVDLWKLDQPDHPVNDADWARGDATVWLNGRWLASPDASIDTDKPHVGVMNGKFVYAVLPQGESPIGDQFDDWLAAWKALLKWLRSGAMLDSCGHRRPQIAMPGRRAWFRSDRTARLLHARSRARRAIHRVRGR